MRDRKKKRTQVPKKSRTYTATLKRKLAEQLRREATLTQESEDLRLINTLNNAVNRGDSLYKILDILARKTQQIFRSTGAVVYIMSEDKQFLVLQKSIGMIKRLRKIGNALGIPIPKEIKISLTRSRIYAQVLKRGKPQLINDRDKIKQLIAGFVPGRTNRRYAQHIIREFRIRSVINIPLLSNGKPFGLIDISRDMPFDRKDLKRFQILAEQISLILNHWQAKHALQESEEKHRHLAENSMDGIVMIQEEKMIFVNTACSTISGYAKDELIGESILKVIAPEDQALIVNRFRKRIRGKKVPNYYTFRGVRKDGKIRYIELSTGPAFRYKGKPTSLVVIRDVTERKEIEEALKNSEERLRKFMKSATEGFALFDAELSLIDVNDFALNLFDAKKEEFLGMNLIDISYHAWESGRLEKYMNVLETGTPTTFDDIVVQSKYGDKHVVIKAFRVGEGMGMIIRDITQLKHTEQALRESEQRYRAIVEEQTDLICRFTPDLVLTYANEAYCKFFNRTKENLVGTSFLELIHTKDRDYVRKKIGALNKANPVGILEERVISPGGKVRWQQWINRALFDEDGEIFEYQSVGRDITGLKEHK
jgi:PAS domain S-box-containing protein